MYILCELLVNTYLVFLATIFFINYHLVTEGYLKQLNNILRKLCQQPSENYIFKIK